MSGWLKTVVVMAVMAMSVLASNAAGPPLQGPLPNAGRPEQRIPFPAIRDWRTLRISLQRTACFGRCPSYTVEISGDGTVAWNGQANVTTLGARAGYVPVAKVKALYRAFQQAQFFWTFDAYRARITDMPTYTVSIAYDGHAKSVIDYVGTTIGMPQEILHLEQAIDRTAQTFRWIEY